MKWTVKSCSLILHRLIWVWDNVLGHRSQGCTHSWSCTKEQFPYFCLLSLYTLHSMPLSFHVTRWAGGGVGDFFSPHVSKNRLNTLKCESASDLDIFECAASYCTPDSVHLCTDLFREHVSPALIFYCCRWTGTFTLACSETASGMLWLMYPT